MRKIKVRNRVYSRGFGTGTVIALSNMDKSEYFCVRFDNENVMYGHDGDTGEFSVKHIPKEWRDLHCRFCRLLGEGRTLEKADDDEVIKVEGTGSIPKIKPYLNITDAEGHVVVSNVGFSHINGWPIFFSLLKTDENVAEYEKTLGTPMLFVDIDDVLKHRGVKVKKNNKETSFA
jgi:hypothetical protein